MKKWSIFPDHFLFFFFFEICKYDKGKYYFLSPFLLEKWKIRLAGVCTDHASSWIKRKRFYWKSELQMFFGGHIGYILTVSFHQFGVSVQSSRKVGEMVRAHFGQSNFSLFQQKRKKEILLILIIFAYFKVQKKKTKKENGQENWSFFRFSNFEVRFKNAKNTVNGWKRYFAIFIFLILLEKWEK